MIVPYVHCDWINRCDCLAGFCYIFIDILECRMPDGCTQLSDARPCHATEPGKVRIQQQLWVSGVNHSLFFTHSSSIWLHIWNEAQLIWSALVTMQVQFLRSPPDFLLGNRKYCSLGTFILLFIQVNLSFNR